MSESYPWDRVHLWRYRARPLRVIDGDTFVALVDTGFHGRYEAHVRVDGIDAPERHADGGVEATERLADALGRATHRIDGWTVRIISLQRERVIAETRSFERYVADVFVETPEGLIDLREMIT